MAPLAIYLGFAFYALLVVLLTLGYIFSMMGTLVLVLERVKNKYHSIIILTFLFLWCFIGGALYFWAMDTILTTSILAGLQT